MTILKKILLAWIALSILSGLWMLITGNTSEEAALRNKLIGICEEAYEKQEDLINTELWTKAKLAGFMNNDIEVDGIIEQSVDASRDIHRRISVGCLAKVDADFDIKNTKVIIFGKVDQDGDLVDYQFEIEGL